MTKAQQAQDRFDLPAGVSADAVREALEKIIASEAFRHSKRLSGFLRFVVEKTLAGEAGALKEYTIGVDVFDKETSFDPRTSTTVRVEARRLRTQLELYYEKQGRNEPVRIRVPKGSYVPSFSARESEDGAGHGEIVPAPLGKLAPSTIAVLPFDDMSPERDQEHFCDGISEEITSALCKVPELRVVSRTSAFAFKGKHLDIRQIGRTLGAGMVLEGSVRKAGDRVRVTVQLVNAVDGIHVWSERYEMRLEDIFAIQDEISWAIAKAMRGCLARGPHERLVRPPTANMDAYELYLLGRHEWNRQTRSGLREACQCFEKAIEADPNFALAHAGVADAYRMLAVWGSAAPHEMMPKAKAAALHALALDDSIGEAHVALGAALAWYDRDWEAAAEEFRRAIRLRPGNPTAHHAYAMVYLAPLGWLDEAILEMERARELDPLSPFILAAYGWALYFARRHEEALPLLTQGRRLDPNHFLISLHLGLIYEQAGRLPDALAAFRQARELSDDNPLAIAAIGRVHALEGNASQARRVLDELAALSRRGYVSAVEVAAIHAALGDERQVFKWLRKADDDRCATLTWLKIDPRFDSLHSHPDFQALLRTVGLSR